MTDAQMHDADDEDCIEIGHKVIEMADRAKVMNQACPGAIASWAFVMDGIRYKLKLTVEPQDERPN